MSDLPRLLLCSFDILPGPTGTSRRLTEYLAGLSDRFQVDVLSMKSSEHPHVERFRGARLLRVPVGSGDLLAQANAFDRAVRRHLDSEEYLLVHFTDPFGGYALSEHKAEHRYRLIYEAMHFPSLELRYSLPSGEPDRRLLAQLRRQELFCLMNADLVLTGSQVSRSFIHSLGVALDSIKVVRAPVDTSTYQRVARVPPTGALRLIYLGGFSSHQGLPTLLRALHHAQHTEVRLTICAPRHPAWHASLQQLVSDLRIDQQVEFLAPVGHAELPALLSRFDVGVLPLEEGERNQIQGGPLAKASEYLAAGCTVVAADLPLTRELLPSEATTYFRAGDFKHLAQVLSELASQPERVSQASMLGRDWAKNHLESARIRAQLVAHYTAVTGLELPARVATSPHDEATMQTVRPDTGRTQLTATPLGAPEAAEDHVEHVSDEDIAAADDEPSPAPLEEPEEISADEVHEAEEPEAEPVFVASKLDPWLAQLAHGYCPPGGAAFARPPPPTTFPGREDSPVPPGGPVKS